MRRFIPVFLALCCALQIVAQPKHEVRAAWLTTAYALDWPRQKANSPEGIRKQKAELIELLDRLYEANFNTVLFQTRTRGEVFYPSAIEPFSATLTGSIGKNPGYDPLAFVIEECHKRGMECHAWMVAIPLGSTRHVNSLGNRSVVKKQRSICITHKGHWYLNPASPETKKYLMRLVDEIVDRYDIDGIHFDYLRYPENEVNFPDAKEYKQYGKGRSREQWRRDNLTEILRYVYRGVKAKKPWVKLSSSPVGKYKNTRRYPSKSWNAYYAVYQDVAAWLEEGIQDQIYPMMYFSGNNFYPFALDWKERSHERHIVPGLGIYFLDPREGNWKRSEVERQIHFTRRNGLNGQAFYRTEHLMNNIQGIYDELNEHFYAYPALQPPMTWVDRTPPGKPEGLIMQQDGGYTTLTWRASADNDPQHIYYVVYGADTYPVDTTKPQHIIARRIQGTQYIHAPVFPWNYRRYYAVSAVDRYGNESEAVQLTR